VQLDHEFTIPVPVAEAWPVLLDVERIAPCMPGATVTKVDGPNIEGTVKVKVGPVTVSYNGTATFLETDETTRRVVLEARGKEARGSGTASATVTAQLHDESGKTRATVSTDLSITGKPAQFGRGVMVDVGNKLLGQFSDCLARKLAAGAEPEPESAPEAVAAPAPAASTSGATAHSAGPAAGATQTTAAPASVLDATNSSKPASRPVAAVPERETDDAIDLLGAAGGPVLKRLAPVLGGVLLLLLLLAAFRRRRA
jgi:carbon monoxide dehydrogenase subunit G